jgi:hypothetical protein
VLDFTTRSANQIAEPVTSPIASARDLILRN